MKSDHVQKGQVCSPALMPIWNGNFSWRIETVSCCRGWYLLTVGLHFMVGVKISNSSWVAWSFISNSYLCLVMMISSLFFLSKCYFIIINKDKLIPPQLKLFKLCFQYRKPKFSSVLQQIKHYHVLQIPYLVFFAKNNHIKLSLFLMEIHPVSYIVLRLKTESSKHWTPDIWVRLACADHCRPKQTRNSRTQRQHLTISSTLLTFYRILLGKDMILKPHRRPGHRRLTLKENDICFSFSWH